MARAAEVQAGLTAVLEAVAAGARPSYGRSNLGYRPTRKVPEVGSKSAHRLFWFEPVRLGKTQGQDAASTLYDATLELHVVLRLVGLSAAEKVEAIDAESVLLIGLCNQYVPPPGSRGLRVVEPRYEPEDEELDEVTMILPLRFLAAEANP